MDGREDDSFSPRLEALLGSGAFDGVVRSVYYPCRRIIGFDDFRQEVLVRAIEHARTFRGDTPGSLIGWLKSIAGNIMVDHLRRSKTEASANLPRSILAREPSTQPAPETLAWLESAIGSLDREDREILDRRYRLRQKWEAMARDLGISPNALAQRHLRIIRRLRRLDPPDATS